MANKEHLAILEQGVKAWNEWRSENKAIEPDLSGAKLIGAKLSEAFLVETNLRRADLSKANLSGAHLRGADLSKANLNRAKLIGADITGADFREAKLIGAKLVRAHINEASFIEARLRGVDLREARLIGADLRRSDLCGADLIRTNLREADLSKADLSGADLQEALLQAARLLNANLDGANLTDSRLWETQRAGWSVKGVICESVYWDYEAKEKTTYNVGEFERLFSDKTRIKLFYKGGISALEILTLPSLIQHLEDSHPGARLRFVSIKEDSGGAVVELAVEGDEDYSQEQVEQLQTRIEKEAQEKAESLRLALVEQTEMRLRLEGEVKQLTRQVEQSAEQLNSFTQSLILRLSQPHITVRDRGVIMGNNKEGDTYNISGQAGAVGPNAHAHDMTFNQLVNQVEKSIDLVALAKELSELRQAMAVKVSESPQAMIAAGKVAEAEIAVNENDAPKALSHLKAAGQWTLDFAKSIGKDVVVAAIKKSMGMG